MIEELKKQIDLIDQLIALGGHKTLIRALKGQRNRLHRQTVKLGLEALVTQFEGRGRTESADIIRRQLKKMARNAANRHASA